MNPAQTAPAPAPAPRLKAAFGGGWFLITPNGDERGTYFPTLTDAVAAYQALTTTNATSCGDCGDPYCTSEVA